MGGVEYEQTDEGIEIWSLCTSGRHRRQGVARALLQHVLNLGAEKVWVSTGMDNTPAKKLYMREGFGLKAQTRTSDGVAICLFEWNARRDSKTKVFAYVIHPCLSNVLIARHVDFPEAGLQVPAGTVEPGEALEDALWREVEEETGLSSECFEPLVRKLGEAIVEVNTSRGSQCHYRHFFRLDVRGDVECLETWQHTETFCDDGSPPVLLEYFWCPVKLARHVLWPGHGEYLDALHQDSSP